MPYVHVHVHKACTHIQSICTCTVFSQHVHVHVSSERVYTHIQSTCTCTVSSQHVHVSTIFTCICIYL